MRNSSLLSIIFFIAIFHQNSKADLPQVTLHGNSSIAIQSAKGTRAFMLPGKIESYLINCNKNRLIAWGTPRHLTNQSPQSGFVSLFDLRKQSLIATRQTPKGVMSVNYLSNRNSAQLILGYSALINLKTGAIKYIEVSEEDTLEFELCPIFSGKSYSRQ